MNVEDVRRYALSLPETTEAPHFQSSSFRIRGKIIATVPPDGGYLHVFVSDEERELALATEPAFLEKLYWGARVAGLRVVLAKAKPGVVQRLLRQAWTHKAPNSLHGALRGQEIHAKAASHVVGYSGTPLARKLGLKQGSCYLLVDPPEGFNALLEPLPDDVQYANTLTDGTDIVHVFATRRSALAKQLARWRKSLRTNAMVWVSWPKQAAKVPTDITESVIRDVALPLGFVDVKVCAVSDVWSGLKLVIRKELR